MHPDPISAQKRRSAPPPDHAFASMATPTARVSRRYPTSTLPVSTGPRGAIADTPANASVIPPASTNQRYCPNRFIGPLNLLCRLLNLMDNPRDSQLASGSAGYCSHQPRFARQLPRQLSPFGSPLLLELSERSLAGHSPGSGKFPAAAFALGL